MGSWEDFPTGETYSSMVASLLAEVIGDRGPSLRETLAFAAPPWFVERLADELRSPLEPIAAGLGVVYLGLTPVVGVPVLDRFPLGEFVVQDLLSGSFYRLSFYCNPDIGPTRWRALSLAVADGLHPEAALELAAMDL